MRRVLIIILGVITAVSFIQAETVYYDEVIITSSHISVPLDNISPSAIVITREDIEKSCVKDLSSLLNLYSGLYLVRNGMDGQASSMFIRGARPSHTAVLYNGVLINDPSTVDGSFDFNNISIGEIERIEIIKDSQGSVHGTNAMGGVINIISRESSSPDPLHLSINAGITSAEGHYENIYAGFSQGLFSIDLNIGNEYQNELYASDPDLLYNNDNDPYRKTYGSLKATLDYGRLTFSSLYRHSYAKSNIDLFGGDYGDDPNYMSGNRYRSFINNLILDLDILKLNLYLSRTDTERSYQNKPDELSTDIIDSLYDGQLDQYKITANLYNKLVLGYEQNTSSMSYDYYSEDGYGPYHDSMSKEEQTSDSFFIELNHSTDSFGIIAGLRHDSFPSDKSLTYRITPFYKISSTGTTIYANISTGFKVPSLYELYSPYGNAGLESERSLSYEFSLSQEFPEKQLNFSLCYFHNRYEELIDFDSLNWQYYNIGKAETRGFELSADHKISQYLNLKLLSTLLYAENLETGETLLRRPKYKHSFILDTLLPYEINLWSEISYVSGRDDNTYDEDYNTVRITLDEYFILNIGISRQFADGLVAYIRIDNLLDEDYEFIKGYAKAERLFYIGLRYSI